MSAAKKAKTLSLGIQHVLAMYAGAVLVPLIVGDALGLTPAQLTYLISADIFMCGAATLLQVWKNRFFGIGLPVVLGCTFTAVSPMIAIGSKYGISSIYGSIIAAGCIVIALSFFFGKLVKFFPPVVTGSVVTIIGITLIPVAMNNMAGGEGSADYGSFENLGLAFLVLFIIVLLYRFTKGFMKAIAILIGILLGTAVAAFLGKVETAEVANAQVFRIIEPFYFRLKDLAKGYRAEGIAVLLGGIFNAFPYTAYSQNVGLIQLTGVKKNQVIVVTGVLLMVFGLFPKIAAFTTIIPKSVLGGAMVAMFGMVIAYGIKMLSRVDFAKQENLLIVACSVGIGLGVTVVPQMFEHLPESIKLLTSNGIVAGSFTAILLHIIYHMIPFKKETEQELMEEPKQSVM